MRLVHRSTDAVKVTGDNVTVRDSWLHDTRYWAQADPTGSYTDTHNDGIQAVIGWLAAVIALGAGIIWHQADPKRRERWSATVPGMPWLGSLRGWTCRG